MKAGLVGINIKLACWLADWDGLKKGWLVNKK